MVICSNRQNFQTRHFSDFFNAGGHYYMGGILNKFWLHGVYKKFDGPKIVLRLRLSVTG